MDKKFNPKKITSEHIQLAIQRIDEGLENVKPSTIFDVVYEGKRYPPKGVMRIAHRLATGQDLWELPGGAPTNNILKELGFDIMTKGSDFGKRKNFWKIAPGAQASHWDEFFNDGIMAVGYSENNIGDLKKFKSFTELGKTIGKENSNEARSLWICCHANNGDIVFANKGRNTVVGIGIINGEYEYQPKREFPHVRKVKWLSNKEWDYVSGQFASDNRNRPTLFRADTLSKTEVGAEILTSYLEKYPEYEDIFVENGVWPVFADGSYDLLVKKAAGINHSGLLHQYFRFLGRLFQSNQIDRNDERAFFSTPKNGNAICFTYDQRYITYLKQENGVNTVFLIHKRGQNTDFLKSNTLKKGQFGGRFANITPVMDYMIIKVKDGSELTDRVFEMVAEALKEMMSSGKAYYFRHIHKDSHNDHIYEVATNETAREQLIFDSQDQPLESLAKMENIKESQQLLNETMNLNTILYGPPGTGKTYHTIDYALNAIDSEKTSALNRLEMKQEFERLVDSGQIVFTTFHQSMSYEDFIEGIKPENGHANGQLTYEVKDGIFKTICEKARANWEASQIATSSQLTFEDAFAKFEEEWEENPQLTIPTKRKEYTILSISDKSIGFRKASGGTSHTLSINTLKEFYYGSREIMKDGLGVYYPGLVDKLKSYKGSSEQVALQNYVIVIDEINRGNVSQIFGELITLIEDNKRLGANERLEVELTYSRDRFGVPPNLYIIGTMNTADRSVEALDTALRRRFNFIEKQPDYQLQALQQKVAGFTLAEILRTLNRRIEKLMDKDHLLGHSYLMLVGSSLSDLKQVFKNKFIPLLQEYFFGDYSRLGLVLGEGFFEHPENDGQIFAKFREVDNSDFGNREIYRLRNMDSMSDREFDEALNGMMQS